VVTGAPIHPGWLGLWTTCRGDLWGYGAEAMEAVRREAATTGAVGPRTAQVEPKVEEIVAEIADAEAEGPESPGPRP
jgi:hypothetical protein